MKSVDFLKVLGGAACVVFACNVYAQGASDAMATSAPTAKATAKATKKSDRSLGLKVRGAIGHAQGVDVSNVLVRARGGVVTLTGTVPDASQIEAAGTAARGVTGVTSVTNRLTLEERKR